MATTLDWPNKVPMLTYRDMCRDVMNGQSDTHCLMGWAQVVFPTEEMRCRALAAMQVGPGAVSQFNDDRTNSQTKLARTWNRAMARLGYVVGNPEAKNVKRKRK